MMIGSSDTTLTIATAVRHHMHVDDPDLIASGIDRVLTATRRRSVR
jgi:hypothetical protein